MNFLLKLIDKDLILRLIPSLILPIVEEFIQREKEKLSEEQIEEIKKYLRFSEKGFETLGAVSLALKELLETGKIPGEIEQAISCWSKGIETPEAYKKFFREKALKYFN